MLVTGSYRFQMCSMGMMNSPCSEPEVLSLYQLHRSRTYSITELTADEQWKAIQQRLTERVGISRGCEA